MGVCPMNRQVAFPPAGQGFQPFVDYAAAELEQAAPWDYGHCFNAACARAFEPSRRSHRFCCPACQRAFEAECRRFGMRAAPALLVHGLTKRAPAGSALAETRKAAQRHLTAVQSGWRDARRLLNAEAQSCE